MITSRVWLRAQSAEFIMVKLRRLANSHSPLKFFYLPFRTSPNSLPVPVSEFPNSLPVPVSELPNSPSYLFQNSSMEHINLRVVTGVKGNQGAVDEWDVVGEVIPESEMKGKPWRGNADLERK